MGFKRISIGDCVFLDGCERIITHVVRPDRVLAKSLGNGAVQEFAIADIPSAAQPMEDRHLDLSLINDQEWGVAEARYGAIRPLLEKPQIDAGLLKDAATRSGRHPATIYRWLKRYNQGRQQTALIPAKRGAVPGQSRLRPEVDAIIEAAIQERYLTQNRIKTTQLYIDVQLKCRSAGFPAPHVNTVRKRISRLSPRTVVKARIGPRAAHEQFAPIEGHLSVDRPLAIVQIDHTKVDLILVDEVYRKPLVRPWLTLAIDVFSRMVVGFYLSLEAPSSAAAGMCIAQGILPKDAALAKWELETPWPVWGKMAAIHCDNGKDFRGAMLRAACQQYGIQLLFRPVRQPQYGGHIERLMGTFAQEIRTLPGTTFANTKDRQGYDSEKRSALTLGELELWMAQYIVEIYHQRPHAGLDERVPIRVYEEGIFRSGLPELCTNERRLRLDFMPFEERAVTVNGIVVDNVAYFHDVLRPWVNAKEKDGRKRRFIVRRDPRDISVVHFFDPELQQYFAVPYRDSSHPAISVWELRETRRQLRQQGRDSTEEDVIFRAYEQMRAKEDDAVHKTKQMRRNLERRNSRPIQIGAPSAVAANTALWEEEIQPFREVVMPEAAQS